MKDFGYCIWFISENSSWYKFTNGFIPHITIKHSLSYSDALRLYLAINPKDINVELDNPEVSVEEDFWALYYKLKPLENKPDWYPNKAHISFIYNYNSPITSIHVNHLKQYLTPYNETFTKIALVYCKGHYKKWKMLQIK